jgi:hypothetical protein
MYRLIKKKNLYSLFNFILVFKVLMLRSKISQIIIFILNTLRGCFMYIQICSVRIQNTPGPTQHESFVPIAQFGTFFCCSSQVLLYAHSKCVGSFSMHLQNMVGATVSCHILNAHWSDKDTLRAALSTFKIKMMILNDKGPLRIKETV